MEDRVDRLCVNALRFLAADMIQEAGSGHPGLPLGAAPMAYVLWDRHLRHNPKDPHWFDRDRFVLSAGHGSALLYALLHLYGYDLPLSQLRRFRRWGSKTPGHPEAGLTPGVEVTTGPLGQGVGMGVGMAIAEAHLASLFNRPGHTVIDHYTYVLASDGDLMEGVAAEASSLAGHLRLGKLIVLYDDNGVSLAGTTNLTFSEDVAKRYEAYGWQVLRVGDGNDLEGIDSAIRKAKEEASRPTLIMVRTVLGYGAPTKAGTYKAHGAPLGEEELAAAKERLGWPTEPKFYVPEEALAHFRAALKRGEAWEREWKERLSRYEKEHPGLAAELSRRIRGELPGGWEQGLPEFSPDEKGVATRKASGKILQALGERIPELIGGSADLNPSVNTVLPGKGDFQAPGEKPEGVQGDAGGAWDHSGRNIHFGVREHAMGAVANGIARHGGLIPFCGTFLVFSDYMRPPMRLAAMMGCRVIYVFTHDSVGIGQDGPTHQPVEQLMGLRTVPGLTVIRPCDASETVEAWKAALQATGPTALILSRQDLPVLDRHRYAPAEGLKQGGYVLWQARAGTPEVIIIATGSEVHVALKAAEALSQEGRNVRVVSLPSWELFERQPRRYREEVLPPGVPRVAVEAGVTLGWERYADAAIGVDRFGASAPGAEVMERLGISPERVVAQVRSLERTP
ncbi:MAG: Transketolase [Acetothermia bacterium 64_32]|nr:MAG: Transketolase [Acetothermia bacterium 64_32]HAF70056.1 transketolase [Candidatus Acetothermia bacterium]